MFKKVIELILFFVIFIFAMPFVRKSGNFQVFFWIHLLTIPWLLIMLAHGRNFWLWVGIPLFLYALENILRFRQISSDKYGETYIEESFILPSKVTHLVIKRPPKFRFNAGDYVFINIPTIAKYEWHPFSISSSPERSDYLWLHIKAAGNWTNKLHAFSMSSKFDVSFSTANRSRQSNPGAVMRTTMMQQDVTTVFDQNPVDADEQKNVMFETNTSGEYQHSIVPQFSNKHEVSRHVSVDIHNLNYKGI